MAEGVWWVQDAGCSQIRTLRRPQGRAGFPAASPTPTTLFLPRGALPPDPPCPASPPPGFSSGSALAGWGLDLRLGPLGCGELLQSQLDPDWSEATTSWASAQAPPLCSSPLPSISGLDSQLC